MNFSSLCEQVLPPDEAFKWVYPYWENSFGEMEDYTWERNRNFSLLHLGSKNGWKEWYEDERKWWFQDYGNNERFDSLEKYWKHETEDPVILVKDGGNLTSAMVDSKYSVIDGNHRVAISHLLGRSSIDAVVGVPK